MKDADSKKAPGLFSRAADYPTRAEEILSCCGELRKMGFDLEPFSAFVLKAGDNGIRDHYSNLFDFNPETAPYASYHAFSTCRIRAEYMAEIARFYKEAGFSTGGEPPDHIPLMLRAFGAGVLPARDWIAGPAGIACGKIADAARSAGSPYGHVYGELRIFLIGITEGGRNVLERSF